VKSAIKKLKKTMSGYNFQVAWMEETHLFPVYPSSKDMLMALSVLDFSVVL
jgi:hypothetical protein